MKLIDILTDINPILRILILIVLAVAAIFTVKIIRRFSQYLLTMKVDSKETSQEILTRRYPKLATIITIFVSAVTFTIYFVTVGMKRRCRKRFNQCARACTTNTDLSFWPYRKSSGSRMSSMVNGAICASNSGFGRDK